MEESKEDSNDVDKIKVFSSEDEKLKMLGELLSNKSSREIIKLLIEKEMYTNEIASKLEIRPNLVIHHLKKLEELGLLEVTNREIVKRGNTHRYFRINPYLFLAPNGIQDKEKDEGILKKIFKDGVKFVAIGIASVVTIILTSNKKTIENKDEFSSFGGMVENADSIIYGLIVIIIGLVILYCLEKKKKKDYCKSNPASM